MIWDSGVLSSPSPRAVLLPAAGAGMVALPTGSQGRKGGGGWDFKGTLKGLETPLRVFRCKTAIGFRLRGFSLSHLLSCGGAQPVYHVCPGLWCLSWAAEEAFLCRAP